MSETMTRPQGRTLLLNPEDNIGVALANLEIGTETPEGATIVRRVPRGHKFAVRGIRAGEAIIKFGQIIGFAREAIPPGDWVHEHNCGMGGADGSLTLYLFKESPGESREGNWLPAPDGPFSLTLRMYLPKQDAIPPHYVPPPLRKVR